MITKVTVLKQDGSTETKEVFYASHEEMVAKEGFDGNSVLEFEEHDVE